MQDSGKGLLTKLHGSIDWQYDSEDITKSGPHYTREEQNHCILYPGYKGVPSEEPFSVFHDHLRNVARGGHDVLKAAIFIGFAFRDNYINSILKNLPEGTFACYFTKKPPDKISRSIQEPPPRAPHTEKFIHLEDGFTEETISFCLRDVAKHISEKYGYKTLSKIAIEGPWKNFTPESIQDEKSESGFCVLRGENQGRDEIVYIDGSDNIRGLLQGLLLYPPGSRIEKHAKLYRITYTKNYANRARGLYDQFVKINGRPPVCNDAPPPVPHELLPISLGAREES